MQTIITTKLGLQMIRLAAVLAAACVTACVSSVEPGVSLQVTPNEDSDYSPVLERATRSHTVFKDFETRLSVAVTYLSPEFRSAFARRLERVYQAAPMQFEEAQSKAGFFVSIDAPVENRTDLTNPHHWTILLNDGSETRLKPILIKKIGDKERWRAFFPTINDWTTEYMIIFDAPSVTPNAKDLVANQTMSLLFANADAHINMTW